MAACADHSSAPAVISPSLHHDCAYDDSQPRRHAVLTSIPSDLSSQLSVPRGATSSSPTLPESPVPPAAAAQAAAGETRKINPATTTAAITATTAATPVPVVEPIADGNNRWSHWSRCSSSSAAAIDSPSSAAKQTLGRLRTTPTITTSSTTSLASTPTDRNPLIAYRFGHPTLPPTPDHQSPSAIRKTSPGLAARLKALGFGTSKNPPSPPTPQHDNVGRLDEDQLRRLDRKLQAASFSAVIARRGRPWKGAAAPSSPLDNSPSPLVLGSPWLPEIQKSEPLAMDTHKYRMPEHTNGNGTKVTLNTRREHLQRNARPPSPDDAVPPPPPPKDNPTLAVTPPAVMSSEDHFVPGLSSYFTSANSRPGSIYTLSRASFASQLAQLTSLQLPDPESLSSKVSAIRSAQVAAKALINAAEQIRSWISKAQEVIGGLDSEDDVEWSAAGGREGLEEVENAIHRFEHLINVYVGAIEELQARGDISTVASDDLRRAVTQMESILDEWAQIRATLQVVRTQVEIAMEWEELWNNVLGDIQGEMDELSRLVFEMEERRHKPAVSAAAGDGVDIGDLETIVEDSPGAALRQQSSNRLSLSGLPMTASSPGSPSLSHDDSSLLALFARMQPLRASLDFLPMRLSVFEARAERSFPTACEELQTRRNSLDAAYKKLERDAESLRKELGEDRWVIVFRGAGRQAQKMLESVQRSLIKLREALDAGQYLTNPATMTKKMESYEAKKTHYGPAIERILSIIEKGVKDRFTVNGEILRLLSDTQSRWQTLKYQLRDMDAILEEIQADRKGQHLRDSVSSMLSNDRSTLGSGHETPGSSPPSSVIMSTLGFDPHTPAPKSKGRSPKPSHSAPLPGGRRRSSLPAPTSAVGRKTAPRLSTIASSPATTSGPLSRTPRPDSALAHRPRWNGSTNVASIDTGHNFKPMSLTTPSPYARSTPGAQRSASSLSPPSAVTRLPTPRRNAFTRASSESPSVRDTPSRTSHSRHSFRERLSSPGPYSQQTLAKPRLLTKCSMSALATNRSVSLQPSVSDPPPDARSINRPASSLAFMPRRSSLLPLPKGKKEESSTVRASSRLSSVSRSASRSSTNKTTLSDKDGKPRWRP
ncbi:cortical protein [Hirsutella rhossiliensis]|uniref:Cortical protein n=1 Tax=Hirsutella rhossiliensis TaxID=111463 RepID=A0A9P8MTJ8_9HYPO|nr:cortical protein [Hirsutella rhossiliensis]KAH0960909.1 cortical protein [Hirsutella rhossiliensis]